MRVSERGCAPAAKAARRSSLPIEETMPAVKRARARYCVVKESRSMRPLRCVNCMNLENRRPGPTSAGR